MLVTPVLGTPLSGEQLARIEALGEVRAVRVSPDGRVHADERADPEATLAEADVLLRGSIPASVLDHVLGHAPRLRWIHSVSAGVEKVATPLARSRGVVVTNARGVFSRPIAEYLVMVVLATARRLPQLLELQRDRTWQPLRGRELSELTVGIVGFGSIGQELARLLAPFGPRIIASRRHPGRDADAFPHVEQIPGDQLDDLLARSDYVVLTVPLTADTEGLIGTRQLQEMREGSILVNVSRGRLVDELALRQALEAGWIGGAVLDVFRDEPLHPDSPLWRTPKLIVTPHTSWSSGGVVERTLDLFIDNLRRYRAGEELRNVVDLEAGY